MTSICVIRIKNDMGINRMVPGLILRQNKRKQVWHMYQACTNMYEYVLSIFLVSVGVLILVSGQTIATSVTLIVGIIIVVSGLVAVFFEIVSLVKLRSRGKAVLVTGCDTGKTL